MSEYFHEDLPLHFLFPINGDCVNEADGQKIDDGILIHVKVKAQAGSIVSINDVKAIGNGEEFAADIKITGYRTTLVAKDEKSGYQDKIAVYYLPNTMGKYRLSSDDNILFLQDLNENRDTYTSIFDNPYLAMYKKVHDEYGACVHLNLFYETDETALSYFSPDRKYFNLSMMTDRYKDEFKANADWLHLAFHAQSEFPCKPYQNAKPEQITEDCIRILREILRFAGKECVADTTTVHFGEANRPCVRALRSLGFRSLTGYFEHDNAGDPLVAYYAPDDLIDHIGARDFFYDIDEDMLFGRIDRVLNLDNYETNMKKLYEVLDDPHRNGFISIMIHEQYFYADYRGYLPDFQNRVLDACKCLHDRGYIGAHIDDITKEPHLCDNQAFL